jgi:hypothetical protein
MNLPGSGTGSDSTATTTAAITAAPQLPGSAEHSVGAELCASIRWQPAYAGRTQFVVFQSAYHTQGGDCRTASGSVFHRNGLRQIWFNINEGMCVSVCVCARAKEHTYIHTYTRTARGSHATLAFQNANYSACQQYICVCVLVCVCVCVCVCRRSSPFGILNRRRTSKKNENSRFYFSF